MCVLLDFIAIQVSFDDSSYTVKEYEGSLLISMFLDNPSPCCLHVFVEFIDGTAHGKLCETHT